MLPCYLILTGICKVVKAKVKQLYNKKYNHHFGFNFSYQELNSYLKISHYAYMRR